MGGRDDITVCLLALTAVFVGSSTESSEDSPGKKLEVSCPQNQTLWFNLTADPSGSILWSITVKFRSECLLQLHKLIPLGDGGCGTNDVNLMYHEQQYPNNKNVKWNWHTMPFKMRLDTSQNKTKHFVLTLKWNGGLGLKILNWFQNILNSGSPEPCGTLGLHLKVADSFNTTFPTTEITVLVNNTDILKQECDNNTITDLTDEKSVDMTKCFMDCQSGDVRKQKSLDNFTAKCLKRLGHQWKNISKACQVQCNLTVPDNGYEMKYWNGYMEWLFLNSTHALIDFGKEREASDVLRILMLSCQPSSGTWSTTPMCQGAQQARIGDRFDSPQKRPSNVIWTALGSVAGLLLLAATVVFLACRLQLRREGRSIAVYCQSRSNRNDSAGSQRESDNAATHKTAATYGNIELGSAASVVLHDNPIYE